MACVVSCHWAAPAGAQQPQQTPERAPRQTDAHASPAEALLRAYSGFLAAIDGNALVWKDGTRMVLDAGRGTRPAAAVLADPDLAEMFAQSYPTGHIGLAPAIDFDPGRARNTALFDKIYGNCLAGSIASQLVPVEWLPVHHGGKVMFSRIAGAAQALAEASAELDRLPESFVKYLKPTAGTFNCRPIAGTRRLSAHGYGIAIDISTRHSHYWQWSKPDVKGVYPYRNEIPWEIVDIFERHGFIWGGKWYHYDTMHFEYRPELLPPAP